MREFVGSDRSRAHSEINDALANDKPELYVGFDGKLIKMENDSLRIDLNIQIDNPLPKGMIF